MEERTSTKGRVFSAQDEKSQTNLMAVALGWKSEPLPIDVHAGEDQPPTALIASHPSRRRLLTADVSGAVGLATAGAVHPGRSEAGLFARVSEAREFFQNTFRLLTKLVSGLGDLKFRSRRRRLATSRIQVSAELLEQKQMLSGVSLGYTVDGDATASTDGSISLDGDRLIFDDYEVTFPLHLRMVVAAEASDTNVPFSMGTLRFESSLGFFQTAVVGNAGNKDRTESHGNVGSTTKTPFSHEVGENHVLDLHVDQAMNVTMIDSRLDDPTQSVTITAQYPHLKDATDWRFYISGENIDVRSIRKIEQTDGKSEQPRVILSHEGFFDGTPESGVIFDRSEEYRIQGDALIDIGLTQTVINPYSPLVSLDGNIGGSGAGFSAWLQNNEKLVISAGDQWHEVINAAFNKIGEIDLVMRIRDGKLDVAVDGEVVDQWEMPRGGVEYGHANTTVTGVGMLQQYDHVWPHGFSGSIGLKIYEIGTDEAFQTLLNGGNLDAAPEDVSRQAFPFVPHHGSLTIDGDTAALTAGSSVIAETSADEFTVSYEFVYDRGQVPQIFAFTDGTLSKDDLPANGIVADFNSHHYATPRARLFTQADGKFVSQSYSAQEISLIEGATYSATLVQEGDTTTYTIADTSGMVIVELQGQITSYLTSSDKKVVVNNYSEASSAVTASHLKLSSPRSATQTIELSAEVLAAREQFPSLVETVPDETLVLADRLSDVVVPDDSRVDEIIAEALAAADYESTPVDSRVVGAEAAIEAVAAAETEWKSTNAELKSIHADLGQTVSEIDGRMGVLDAEIVRFQQLTTQVTVSAWAPRGSRPVTVTYRDAEQGTTFRFGGVRKTVSNSSGKINLQLPNNRGWSWYHVEVYAPDGTRIGRTAGFRVSRRWTDGGTRNFGYERTLTDAERLSNEEYAGALVEREELAAVQRALATLIGDVSHKSEQVEAYLAQLSQGQVPYGRARIGVRANHSHFFLDIEIESSDTTSFIEVELITGKSTKVAQRRTVQHTTGMSVHELRFPNARKNGVRNQSFRITVYGDEQQSQVLGSIWFNKSSGPIQASEWPILEAHKIRPGLISDAGGQRDLQEAYKAVDRIETDIAALHRQKRVSQELLPSIEGKLSEFELLLRYRQKGVDAAQHDLEGHKAQSFPNNDAILGLQKRIQELTPGLNEALTKYNTKLKERDQHNKVVAETDELLKDYAAALAVTQIRRDALRTAHGDFENPWPYLGVIGTVGPSLVVWVESGYENGAIRLTNENGDGAGFSASEPITREDSLGGRLVLLTLDSTARKGFVRISLSSANHRISVREIEVYWTGSEFDIFNPNVQLADDVVATSGADILRNLVAAVDLDYYLSELQHQHRNQLVQDSGYAPDTSDLSRNVAVARLDLTPWHMQQHQGKSWSVAIRDEAQARAAHYPPDKRAEQAAINQQRIWDNYLEHLGLAEAGAAQYSTTLGVLLEIAVDIRIDYANGLVSAVEAMSRFQRDYSIFTRLTTKTSEAYTYGFSPPSEQDMWAVSAKLFQNMIRQNHDELQREIQKTRNQRRTHHIRFQQQNEHDQRLAEQEAQRTQANELWRLAAQGFVRFDSLTPAQREIVTSTYPQFANNDLELQNLFLEQLHDAAGEWGEHTEPTTGDSVVLLTSDACDAQISSMNTVLECHLPQAASEEYSVFYLLDENSMRGLGHAAVLMGSDREGWYYFSYGANSRDTPLSWGRELSSTADNLDAFYFETLAEAKAETKRLGTGYSDFLRWEVEREDVRAAFKMASSLRGTRYKPVSWNCDDAARAVLSAAGIDMPLLGGSNLNSTDRFFELGPLAPPSSLLPPSALENNFPASNFERAKPFADEWGEW